MGHVNDSAAMTAWPRDVRLRVVSIAAVFGMVAAVVLAGPSGSARAATQIDLGTAGSFAVLGGSAITNSGATTITGDVGLDPESAVSGFEDVTQDGELHVADAPASLAKDHLVLAYDSAVGQGPATTVVTELGGQLLLGGVYDSADGTFQITDTLTLDAQGTPSTVWVFQTDTTLITASDSVVNLINGADPCNVYWQVGSSATLGERTDFAGNILALTSITLNTSATITGRALARNGAVTMLTNTITRPNCETAGTPPPGPSPSPSPSPTPSASPSPAADPTPSPTPPTPSPSPTPAVAGPGGSTTGTPDASTGTSVTAGTPDAPVAAPPTSGAPQVPAVPTGSVGAGDGSMATDATSQGAAAALALLPLLATLGLYAIWRRRTS